MCSVSLGGRVAHVLSVCLLLASATNAYAGPKSKATQPASADSEDRAKFQQSLKENPTPIYFVVQMALGRFGYGVTFSGQSNEQTVAALRQFQERNGLKPTGLPDYDTAKLILDYKSKLDAPVYSLPFKTFRMSEEPYLKLDGTTGKRSGRVVAEGAWEMTRGGKLANRNRAITIECERQDQEEYERISLGHCVEKMAVVSDMFGMTNLYTIENYFRVAYWDDRGIITEPVSQGLTGNCTETTMRIVFATKRVTQTRIVNTKDMKDCPVANTDDVEIELVDGIQLAEKWQEEQRELFRKVMVVDPKFYETGKK